MAPHSPCLGGQACGGRGNAAALVGLLRGPPPQTGRRSGLGGAPERCHFKA